MLEIVTLNDDNKIYHTNGVTFYYQSLYRCEDVEMNMKRIYADEHNSVFISFEEFQKHFHYVYNQY